MLIGVLCLTGARKECDNRFLIWLQKISLADLTLIYRLIEACY